MRLDREEKGVKEEGERKGEMERRREGETAKEDQEEGGEDWRQAPRGSRVGCPGGLLAPPQSPSGRGRGHPAAEWEGTRALGHWPAAGGRADIGQRKGAGPPSGMYYGASGTSVRAGGARASSGLPGGRAGDLESARREPSAPTSLPAPPGPRGESRSSGARAGGRTRARAGLPAAQRAPPGPGPGSRGRVGSAFSPLLPLSLHLGFFLSFPFFLLFFQ